MALERQSIERKDFPVGRRGYDPEAVDAHLSALADEIDELKRSARRRTDTLASSASDRVRAIVEAAETSATDIQRDAEADAREIRDEANAEAAATREQATQSAREYVGNVSESTDTMLERLSAMQTELDSLIESLRTGTGRLSSDLKLLETNLTEVRGVLTPRPEFEPEGSAEPALAPGQPDDTQPVDGESTPVADAASPEPTEEAVSAQTPAGETASPGSNGGSQDDLEGARLIALNMALNGTAREETAKYLADNFSLSDADGLLDEVYASVEG